MVGEEAPQMNFDLVSEPWIPIRTPDGALPRRGLRETLLLAHESAAVEHPIPIVEAGLLRFLGAVALDAVQPGSIDDLIALYRHGRFDEQVIGDYLDRHRDVFDLFSAKHPFLQDATAEGGEKPVAGLLPAQPGGTFVAHWHHVPEADFAVCPAEAAALLTAVAPFMTAGGAGLAPSINGAPPWYVLLAGPTLFHTIILNMWVGRPREVKLGTPAWRRRTPLDTAARRTSATLLEALTWQPRRIRLLPGPGGRCSIGGEESAVLVRTMQFTKGESCDFPWTDPNVGYVFGKDGKRVPVRPREDHDPWRDVAALALLNQTGGSGRHVVRPAVVSQFAEMCERDESLAGEPIGLLLFGMRTDLKMKVFEWLKQPLALPVPLLHREERARHLLEAVQRAEDVQAALRKALARAVRVSEHEPGAEREVLVREGARAFWNAVEPHFHALARTIAPLEPEGDAAALRGALETWHRSLDRLAQRAFGDATSRLRLDGVRLLAVAAARSQLARQLRAILTGEAAARPAA